MEALGPQGYLINIARGSVVDQGALVELLAGGALAGAGLDVYADEPRVPAELLALDNVVLLPTSAAPPGAPGSRWPAWRCANLDSFLETWQLVTPVRAFNSA